MVAVASVLSQADKSIAAAKPKQSKIGNLFFFIKSPSKERGVSAQQSRGVVCQRRMLALFEVVL
jgi:hypothetical protein